MTDINTIVEVTDVITVATTEILQTTSLESVEIGQQGPPGPQGVAGGSIEGMSFSFNEVSPIAGSVVVADKLILEARLVIEMAFAADATLSIGDDDDHESLLLITQNDPVTPGTYISTPMKSYPTSKVIKLYMNPGTDPTQGAGRFFIWVEG